MKSQSGQVEAGVAKKQMELILGSRVFQKAQRSQRFLRYVVDAGLQDPPLAVKEYGVAMDVFDRDPSYDPAIDATVRVEASRLRSRLREYYVDDGRHDPVIIEIPKGGYSAVFKWRNMETWEIPQESEAPPENRVASETHDPATLLLPKSRAKGFVATAVIFLLLFTEVGGWRWWQLKHRSAISASPRPIAILPISNGTADPGLKYLADGLTISLIRNLSYVPDLKLTAHDSAFHFRNQTADARTAGKALGVADVLTGELHQSGDHLTLTAELSNVQDGSVIFSREYQADGNDLRSVQANLQHDILNGLHVERSARDPGHSGILTPSADAYREFLQGDFTAQGNSPAELHEAIGHFEKAVVLDPRFDLAWADLATAHVLLGLYFEAPRDHMPLGKEYAEKALALNPGLGAAHGTLGVVHLTYDWDVPAAQSELALANAQQAAMSTLACTAHLLESTGRPHVAEEMLGHLISYDPQSSALVAELGCVSFYRGNYDAAIQQYREALKADPRNPIPYWGLGKSFNQQGRYDEALEAVGRFKQVNGFEPPLLTAETGYAFGASGKKQEALNSIHTLLANARTSYVDPYFVAIIYLSMKDEDQTFRWLDKAFEARSPFLISLPTEPKWESLRTDPRFEKFIGDMRRHPK